MITARTRGAAAVLGAAVVLGLSACSTGQTSSAAGAAPVAPVSGKISLTYLQKQGDQQYFIDEANGAKAKAAQLGIDLKVVNLGNDANKTVSEVQSAIAQKSNGLIVVVPDPAVGPQVVQTARDAKVALLTSDDQVCTNSPTPSSCDKANLVPRIGFSGQQMGTEVGKRAAEEFKKAGWNPADTRVISAWKQDVTVCGDRVKAAKDAFNSGAGASVQNIDVATDNTPTGAQDKVAATLTANPGVKHWVVWGCNDENVQGGVTALQNANISPANIIGVGLGAYLACKDWGSGAASGMKASLFINGSDIGALAVQTMYDKLKNGKDMPAEAFAPTTMVDAATWQSAGVKCALSQMNIPSTAASGAGLAAEAITKRFGPVQALRDVTLHFPPGQVTALMGENGAGKSTLLRILTGDHQPTEGRVLLDGQVLDLDSPIDARRAGIRIIPQEPEIIPHVSVAENVYAGSLPRRAGRRLDRAELRRRITADLERLGFDKVLDPDLLGSQLTAAQRQLVEILRALTGDTAARAIAFDEPTSSLSDHEVDALFALIGRLRDAGIAVIYVSHRMKEIFRLADRIAVLRDGTVAGTVDAGATDEGELVRLMVGRDLSTLFVRQHVATDRVVLQVDHLTTDDVHDVSLEVRAGEVLALAGLIGAGRSELALALAGDTPVRSGTIRVDGSVVRLRGPRDAIRCGIGLAPEERKAQALFLQRTIRDNTSLVSLGRLRRWRFVNRGREKALAQDYANRLRVRAPSIEAEVRTLSGGNQQKVVLARWLARKPALLILDEPTRGVDIGAKAEIYQIIADLARQGTAILVISSELPEVLGLADRVIVMQNGRVTGHLDHTQATEEAILALAMADDLTPDLPHETTTAPRTGTDPALGGTR